MNLKNRVGLGAFPLADVFARVTPRQAEEIIQTFIKNGGYYITNAVQKFVSPKEAAYFFALPIYFS